MEDFGSFEGESEAEVTAGLSIIFLARKEEARRPETK